MADESKEITMEENSGSAQVTDFANRTVVDTEGDKVGTVFDVYVDEDTEQPEWLAVSTGLFGTKISFVPIAGAALDGDGTVVIAYPKALVKDAPRAEADGQLSEAEERDLYDYYGRTYEPPFTSASGVEPSLATEAPPAVNPTRDIAENASASMIRSEEELSVDKHLQEAGRVKLRKWVETDQVHVTVPVQRQMARVVRESVRHGDPAVGDFAESEEEIVLSEEVVDVSKRVVGKERIALETETVIDQVDVDESVRMERVEVEGDGVIDDGRSDRR